MSARALAGWGVLAAGCHVPAVDYTGKQCPCPSPYACDVASNTCVRGEPIDAVSIDAMTCPANGFFCDGFETGDTSRWTTTDLSPGATLTVEKMTAHTGKFALTAKVPQMMTNGAIGAVVEDFPALSTGVFAARAWIYLPQPLINFDSVITVTQAPHALTVDGNTNGYWTVTEHTGAMNPPDYVSMMLSTTNTWTCVELDYQFETSNGKAVITLYIDDAVVLAVTAVDTAAAFAETRVGVSRADAAGDAAIVDDVVLATQHVGCE